MCAVEQEQAQDFMRIGGCEMTYVARTDGMAYEYIGAGFARGLQQLMQRSGNLYAVGWMRSARRAVALRRAK